MERDGKPGQPPLRIALLWHSLSSANLGVRALTLSQLAMLDAIAARHGLTFECRLIGTGGGPAPGFETPRIRVLDGVQPVGIKPWHPHFRGFLGEVRRADLVLDIGEGDSFTDLYGGNRYLRQVVSRLGPLAFGRPLLLGPQTIGPFRPGLHEIAPRLILRRARHVAARDDASRACARRLAPRRAILAATDLAMALPHDPPPPRPAGPPRVGINVSGLLYGRPDLATDFGIRLDYRATIHTLIERFTAEHGAQVVIVDHVLGNGQGADDDTAASLEIAARYPQVTRAPRFTGPSEAKSFIAGLDFFTGARMHACIAAFSALTPHVPMAYSRKATGLFASLGYSETVDLAAETDPARVVDRVLDGFDRRAELRARAGTGLAEARARLGHFEVALTEELLAVARERRA